jgi:DNA primase
MPILTLKEVNEIDLVDFLSKLGYEPKRISGPNYWYLSMLPGRIEKTPSFRVNRKRNRWTDWGTSQGGSVVDFGILYFHCTIRELVIRLSGAAASFSSLPQHRSLADLPPEPKIRILHTRAISAPGLVQYLHERHIPLSIARKCR